MTTSPLDEHDNRRIAILNDQLYGGGVERLVSYQSKDLLSRRKGILLLFDSSRLDFDYGGQLASLYTKLPPYGSAAEEFWCLLQSALRLARVKRKYKIGLCISHKEGPNFANVLTGWSGKTVVTVHEHKSTGIKYGGFKRWLTKRLIKYVYARADHVVTVSHCIASDLVANFGVNADKITVIHNPCDTHLITSRSHEPIEPEYAPFFKSPLVVSVGRLDTQKGHWHLIRAFQQVKKRVPEACLVLIGTGDHAEYLANLAASLDLPGSVKLIGLQENPFKYLRRADVFALSSLWEGLPLVIAEAMACGVPVVCADCQCGPEEMLSPDVAMAGGPVTDVKFAEFGVLTPPLDGRYRAASETLTQAERCLAEAIIRLLEDAPLRQHYRARGIERVKDFSLDHYATQWNQLIDSI